MDLIQQLCKQFVGVIPETEVKFHPIRRWRFDYAFPEKKLAVEIDGGLWQYGRHNRASGRIKDMEKENAAAVLGWRILYFTPQQAKKTETYKLIAQAYGTISQ